MPIYEYECDACQKVFDELILRKQDHPDGCPACGGDQVHRVISQTSFQLKGGGWYVTDFKGSSTPPSKEAAATGSTTGPSEGSGASTESAGDASSAASPPAASTGGDAASSGDAPASPAKSKTPDKGAA